MIIAWEDKVTGSASWLGDLREKNIGRLQAGDEMRIV